ncbi:MAG: substrate-binding domain-containing protein [Spirochaetota bacterium]
MRTPHAKKKNAAPAYRTIFESLTSRADSGDVNVSETSIMEEFDVSRDTARKALDLLEREGFARRIRGRGTVLMHKSEASVMRVQVLVNENFFRSSASITLRHKFYGIMDGVIGAPGAAERSVSITLVRNEDTLSQKVKKIVAEGGGVLIFSSSGMEDIIQALASEQFPHMVHAPADTDMNSVATDARASVHKAATIMLRSHKRILFLTEDSASAWAWPMIEALRTACTEGKVIFDDTSVISCGSDGTVPDRARDAIASNAYDGVIVSTSELARAVQPTIMHRTPKEISFLSCEDHPDLARMTPAVSAIRVPYADIGRSLVTELAAQIRFGYRPGMRIILPEELIIRDTL